ncbi:hypothetical protein OS035_06430 [Rhizobium sp. 268]|uniref:hypothetical protein n=1 Tax=Rhizobium sp. 268 TaxID=2996375 RepID=UPI002F91FF59
MALVEWDLMQLPDAYVQRTLQSMERNVEVAASKIETVRGLDATAREVTRSASDILDILRQARNQVSQGERDTNQTATQLKAASDRLNLTSGVRRT